MDLAHGARALTSAQQRVALSGLTGPAESTPSARRLTLFLFLVHDGWHFCELLKILILAIREGGVGTVAFLDFFGFRRVLHRNIGFGIADFFDGELDATDFQDVTFNNLIVLPNFKRKTY